LISLFLGTVSFLEAEEGPKHLKFRKVPFTEVTFGDDFWKPRLETNRKVSIPHNYKWCEETGRFTNFAKAAGLMEGKFEGIYFNDSDVYKVLEGTAYSLAQHPDEALEARADKVIDWIAASQHENGYINSYYTLVEPDKKWTNLRVRHELYCGGHMFEAAVAYARATGKEKLLEVSKGFAKRVDEIFGPDRRHDVPGHEEIELALVKLYQLTDDPKYMDMAEFFLDIRGDASKRPEGIYGEYCQDHLPVREQSEIVGHAVRAMYLYSGVADVAAYTGDQGYLKAMDRLWNDVVRRKMYVTGGVGARHSGESFGDAYELPNDTAYCETCAAIGLALWSHRLNLLHGDAHYADVMERAIYNGILSGIGYSGDRFFYVNPLSSGGGHHRQPFFSCACCPTNVVRFVPSLPGYQFATTEHGVVANLFVAGDAEIALPGGKIDIQTQTNYPWDGEVRFQIEPKSTQQGKATFSFRVRIPEWARGETTLIVDGKNVEPEVEKGYAELTLPWSKSTEVALRLPMEVQRIVANPKVEADRGRVALQRGPLVYCFEGCDNDGRTRNIMLARDPEFETVRLGDLLDGVMAIRCRDVRGRKLLAVPYHAWDHREAGPMDVWVRQDGLTRSPEIDDPAWEGKLYRPLSPAMLGPSEPLTLAEKTWASASKVNDSLGALNDDQTPENSCDHSIPRFTWWPNQGSAEWVQYEFDEPVTVLSTGVYWFDDGRLNRHCRVPESWRLLSRDDRGNWVPVETDNDFGTTIDTMNRVAFEPVTTDGLRIEVQLKPKYSGGILEWDIDTEEPSGR
jgi:hypothetical protein